MITFYSFSNYRKVLFNSVLNFRLITIALQIDLSFFQRSPATDENHHTQVAKKCYKMIQFR